MRGSADFGSKTKFESGWYPAGAVEFATGENRTIRLYQTPAPEKSKTVETPTTTTKPTADDGEPRGPSETKTVTASTEKVQSGKKPDETIYFIVGPEGSRSVLSDQR